MGVGMRCQSCGNENREGARFCDSCGAGLAVDAPAVAPAPEQLPANFPAEIAGGRYRIRSFLGQGGRKRVFLADEGAADRQVAIALFETEGVDAAVGARARREAQAMRKLGDHPHVVSVLDTGEEGGNPFIVSEYMPGGDVQSLLASEGGRLEIERAIEVAADVTRALEHAHSRGIVHRDLKPANIWLDEGGAARLGDFGLATTEGRARVSRGALVGTVAYLPPEQALGEAAGPQSDLYSLGALLYEMLTGQTPFPGDDAVAIISRHLHSEPARPSTLNPEVPEALDRIVLDLLAKSGDDRPAGAAAARERLQTAMRGGEESAEAPEEENPLDRLVGGAFVGREREIEQLRGSVDSTLEGAGRVTLLVGEPGIGKTRAAEELATYARVRGMRVYWGRCRDVGGAPAYWPWVQAIRELARDSDPVAMAWQMGADAPQLAALVPEVAERLDIEPADLTDSEEARFRLFDAVTSYLLAAARDRPMMLVLDDLHWADEPSLQLLRYAAAETGSSGLLICGTYRDVELGRHHPLARVLAELGGDRVGLRGLDLADIATYIESVSGSAPVAGLAEAVQAQTDGNPFFVGEVVRLLASEGRLSGLEAGSWGSEIPQGVREVVGRRLDRLSDRTNEALRVAAAIGREFDEELVVEVAGMPMAELAEAAGEAVAERLVTDLGGGRFSFSHALVRDTLYDELSEAERGRLHARIATALERTCGEDADERLGELAHHFLAGAPLSDAKKALHYAELAGAQDMVQLAYEDAAALYRRALEVLALTEDPDPARRAALLLALGGAEASSGRLSEARRAFRAAGDSARERGDSDVLVGAAIGVAMQSEAGSVDEELVALLDEALVAIGPARTAERASLLSVKAQELYWGDEREDGKRLVTEAVEIARELGQPMTLAAALHRQIFTPFGPDAPVERLRMADEMLALGREAGEREVEVRAHVFRLWALLELGDTLAFDRELEIYATKATELRMPQHTWQLSGVRAVRAMLDGEIDLAEELAQRSLQEGLRAEQPLATQFYGVQMNQIRGLQGRSAELIDPIRELVERFPGIPAWRTALIGVASRAGEMDLARRELERLVPRDLSAIPPDANWLTGIALLGEAAARLADRERASWAHEELLPYAGRVIVVARAVGVNGPVDLVLGMLARAMGRQEEAMRRLSSALALSSAMGDRPYIAIAHLEIAETLMLREGPGDREAALDALAEAIALARGMGARWIVDRALPMRLAAQGLEGVDVTTSIDDVVEAIEAERPDLRPHAAPDGTVTILFSDIEDSTVLTERLGDERWLEVLRSHNYVFREHLRRHGGFEVKNQGDGFMLAFPDPRQALECAIAVQRAFAERGTEDVSLRIRMGLHTGEVIAEDGDFFGVNVIMAARIAARANGSEILVSDRMRAAAGDLEARLGAGRELELKGLAGTHTIFAADWSADVDLADEVPTAGPTGSP
jgi:eukaryotic-like serine/threonine-protein kinase